MEQEPRSVHRGYRLVVAVVVVLALLAWAVLGTRYILRPTVDEPRAVDAVYVLGAVSPERLEYSLGLMEAGYSERLIMTVSDIEPWDEFCRGDHAFAVTCVTPDPLTTRGEARSWAELAEGSGWDSVMVVTMIPHLTRAELYFQRCFDGEIVMVDDQRPLEASVWARQLVYETAAFVRYAVARGC